MKLSKYNFFLSNDALYNKYIVYNSFTNALASLSKEEYFTLIKFDDKGKIDLGEDTIAKLKSGGIIIEDDISEIEIVREHMLEARYNSTSMGLTIAPTTYCNFRCKYCYEKGSKKNKKMPFSVQSSIVKFVENHAKTLLDLDVMWYGGEPLLEIDIIENLTNSFRKISSKNNINYRAGMISNGYLLNSDMVDRLVENGISFCQITIDGTEEEHEKRRPHYKGDKTYNKIINNICDASKKIKIGVRVNIDKNNLSAAFSVKNILEENDACDVMVYPAPIRPDFGCYPESICFEHNEFMKFENDYFLALNNLKEIALKYPMPHGNSCCADSHNAYVIGPNGDIFKCWSDIGRDEYCIGNIKNNTFNLSKAIYYSKYDPTRDDKCSLCKFLPICMGGCPKNAVEKKDSRCLYSNREFEEYLTKQVELIENDNIKE